MKIEVSEDKLKYAMEVCRKYSQIRIIAEEAEASWKQNLEMVAESKYPDEKEMYEQQAAEDLAKYTAAREWLELVNVTVAKIHEQKARMVIRQNCLAGSTMKSIMMDNREKRYMSRSTATRYKKAGLSEMAMLLSPIQSRLWQLEKKFLEMTHFEAI